MKWLAILALLLAPARTPAPEPRLVYPHQCIEKINTDHAWLAGPDDKHMIAYGIKITVTTGCGYWEPSKD